MKADEKGFTLVELVIAMIILITGVLGIGVLSGNTIGQLRISDVRLRAAHAAEDRLSRVMLDDRYEVLDSLYSTTETNLVGLDGFSRKTEITRFKKAGQGQRIIDYQIIMITVDGPELPRPVVRSVTVAAP